MHPFANAIIQWYRVYGRELPWRGTTDPYKIWISEIILQQTRVAQGYDYYCRFIERFPDYKALATAQEDEVMRYWQGLGYYSRARNLHTAARQIHEAGAFPTTYTEVRNLKGVGDYTAAAICSFAYQLPYAVVDGNVYRVLARYFGIDTPIDSTQGKKVFAALAQELLPAGQSALYNQGIMDFGALQCTPASPACMVCPLVETCAAFSQQTVEKLPVKSKKIQTSHRYFAYFFIRQGEYTYIRKRTDKDIWRNLYEVPVIESATKIIPERIGELIEACFPLLQTAEVTSLQLIQSDVKHILTHRTLHAHFYTLEVSDDFQMPETYQKVQISDLDNFAFPRLLLSFFSLILTARS